MRLFHVIAIALPLTATAAFADETSGTIIAYDRLDNIIVLEDKTFWTLGDKTLVPSDLKAGDAVTLTFKSDGDNGAGPVTELTRN